MSLQVVITLNSYSSFSAHYNSGRSVLQQTFYSDTPSAPAFPLYPSYMPQPVYGSNSLICVAFIKVKSIESSSSTGLCWIYGKLKHYEIHSSVPQMSPWFPGSLNTNMLQMNTGI
jgi:hypothetical protein